MGSSQPADDPDEPLRAVGSHEFLRTESSESVEYRRHAGMADDESLRPAPVDSRRNITLADDSGGGGDDSESRRDELMESRRNEDVDDVNESRRNDDGNEDGWWHRVSRPGEPSTMESRRRMLAAGIDAGTESRRGTAAAAVAAPEIMLPRWWWWWWWCRCSDFRRLPPWTSQSAVTEKCTFSLSDGLLVLPCSPPLSASFTSSNKASSLFNAADVAVILFIIRTAETRDTRSSHAVYTNIVTAADNAHF